MLVTYVKDHTLAHLPEVLAPCLVLSNGLGSASNDLLNREDKEKARIPHEFYLEMQETICKSHSAHLNMKQCYNT